MYIGIRYMYVFSYMKKFFKVWVVSRRTEKKE